MNELRQIYCIADLLKIMSMARSTFYYQQKALRCSDKYAQIKQVIQQIFESHKGRYGYRRVTAAIRNMGYLINRKTVRRLMRQLKLICRIRVKKYRSYKGKESNAAQNHLQRRFKAERPNVKWVTDVTEFNVAGKKLYLSPILDLYNGEIISYHIAERPQFDMVEKMLSKAFSRLNKEEKPMLHSDQGWQYQMSIYQGILRNRNIVQSMSRKGNCLDNAVMENFFGILKSEFFYTKQFKSTIQLAKGLKEYIHYYNNERIKMKLGGLSPVAYRMQALSKS